MTETPSLVLHPISFSGSCLCGAVRFRGRGLRDIVFCHCRQCRHAHGALAAYTAAARDALTFAGEEALTWYRSSPRARRGFCRHCGSTLLWDARDSATIAIAAGALDPGIDVKTVARVFVDDRSAVDEIDDALLSFPGSLYHADHRRHDD